MHEGRKINHWSLTLAVNLGALLGNLANSGENGQLNTDDRKAYLSL